MEAMGSSQRRRQGHAVSQPAPRIGPFQDRPAFTARRTPEEAAIEAPALHDRLGHLDLALRAAISFYQDQLGSGAGASARNYLIGRGFGREAADLWQLGYAVPSWDALSRHLIRQGIGEEAIVGAGLAGRAKGSSRLYDLMRGRLIFPILDEEGTPRGLAGRLVVGSGPKYLNSPGTARYTKRELLYGLNHAKSSIERVGRAVVVEGYTDAIAAHQVGLTSVVATGGVALTDGHVDKLAAITDRVVLAFDGDAAGTQASATRHDLVNRSDVSFQVANLPAGKDPADLLVSGNAAALEHALDASVPLASHLVQHILNEHNLGEVEGRVRALRATTPLIDSIRDPGTRAAVLDHIANRLDDDPAFVETAVRYYASKLGTPRPRPYGREFL